MYKNVKIIPCIYIICKYVVIICNIKKSFENLNPTSQPNMIIEHNYSFHYRLCIP